MSNVISMVQNEVGDAEDAEDTEAGKDERVVDTEDLDAIEDKYTTPNRANRANKVRRRSGRCFMRETCSCQWSNKFDTKWNAFSTGV